MAINALTDRPLSEGVVESAVGGFIVGASFGAAAPEATTAFFARAGGSALRTGEREHSRSRWFSYRAGDDRGGQARKTHCGS